VQIQIVGTSAYAAGLYRQAAVVTICTCAAAIHLQTDCEYKSTRASLTGDFLRLRSEPHTAIEPATISFMHILILRSTSTVFLQVNKIWRYQRWVYNRNKWCSS